jgi:hypothetical protein
LENSHVEEATWQLDNDCRRDRIEDGDGSGINNRTMMDQSLARMTGRKAEGTPEARGNPSDPRRQTRPQQDHSKRRSQGKKIREIEMDERMNERGQNKK